MMQKQLLEQLQKNQKEFHDIILSAMQEYSYRFKRYGVDYTVALYALSDTINIDIVKSMIRKTDRVIELDEHFFCIIFDFVEADAGLKASENILAKIEPQIFGKKIFVSVVNSKDASSKEEHIRKLFDLLSYEIKNNIDDVPLVI